MTVFRTTILILLVAAQSAFAIKMDVKTHDMIIRRLKMAAQNMNPKDPARTQVLLRLADLYSDRARLKAMKEMGQNCQKCEGAATDRDTAIRFYKEALVKTPKKEQGRVVLQIAHLYDLNGQDPRSISLYRKILKGRRGVYSSEVRALAFTNIAEIDFRKGNFKTALLDYKSAQRENLKSKALVAYRIGWCEFNIGHNKTAIKDLVRLLQDPNTLITQSTDGKSVDPAFVADVSHDLAIFLAREPVGPRQIQMLRDLSPQTVRGDNLKTLAEEADRLGKKSASLIVWAAYVDEGGVKPKDRLMVQTRVAKIFYDMNKQKLAANALDKALGIWKTSECASNANSCQDIHQHMRQLITAWNKGETHHPSESLFHAYKSYLSVFPNEADMWQWAAVVGRDLHHYKDSGIMFHNAAILAASEVSSHPKDKEMRNIFEGSLLGQIAMAEDSKDLKAREAAYDNYLKMNPNGAEAFEVRYQRAQTYYAEKRYQDAFSEFHYLAETPDSKHRDLRVKSADLALSCLADLHDDKSLQVRSLEYARFFPEKKTAYLGISRKATMNLVAGQLKNGTAKDQSDYQAGLASLSQVSLAGANDKEKIKYYKDKILVAEKALQLNVVKQSADQLLRIRKLSKPDHEWALAQKVWAAETALNFPEAYRIASRMKFPHLTKAQRELRLALLSQLAGLNPNRHYKHFLRWNRDLLAGNQVRVTLVKGARSPWRELTHHLRYLKRTPALLADLVLEIYARQPNAREAQKLLRTTTIGRYAAGQTLKRHLELPDYLRFDRKIRSHRIRTYNDYAVKRTLKQRLNLIAQAERRAKATFRQHDWTLEVLALSTLARGNSRLGSEILSLPAPRHLTRSQQFQYRHLLQQKSQGYLARAQDVEAHLNRMWSNSSSVRNLEAAYLKADASLRRLYRQEIVPLAQNAPERDQKRLEDLLNTPVAEPTNSDIEQARRDCQSHPFDVSKVQYLRQLESQRGHFAMAMYLDERISQLKKGQEL